MNPHDNERFNLSRIAIQHPAITGYLLIVLMLAGIAAYFQLGQDEDPPFTFRAMVVRAYWPGATAMQMSEQVTDRLEKTLQEVPYMDKIRSYSKPGESTIFVELKDSAPPHEIPGIWYTIRKKIGDMRGELPQGVQGPFFNDEFGDVFGVIYAVSAEGFSYAELKDYADFVRQELLRVPGVAKVDYFGEQPEHVYIEISNTQLTRLGVSPQQIAEAINSQNAVASAGTLTTADDRVFVRPSGQFQDTRALAETLMEDIACHPQLDPALLRHLQAELRQMYGDGWVQALYGRYGMQLD